MKQYNPEMQDFTAFDQMLEIHDGETRGLPPLLFPMLFLVCVPLGLVFWVLLFKNIFTWMF